MLISLYILLTTHTHTYTHTQAIYSTAAACIRLREGEDLPVNTAMEFYQEFVAPAIDVCIYGYSIFSYSCLYMHISY